MLLACVAHGDQKRASETLELELQTVESFSMGAENRPQSSAKTASSLNCRAISLAPKKLLLRKKIKQERVPGKKTTFSKEGSLVDVQSGSTEP